MIFEYILYNNITIFSITIFFCIYFRGSWGWVGSIDKLCIGLLFGLGHGFSGVAIKSHHCTHPYLTTPCYWQKREKPTITHQEPDAELTEKPLVMLIVLLVIKLDVVQRVVGGRQAHLTTAVQLKLTLFCMYFRLLQKAGGIRGGWERRFTENQRRHKISTTWDRK